MGLTLVDSGTITDLANDTPETLSTETTAGVYVVAFYSAEAATDDEYIVRAEAKVDDAAAAVEVFQEHFLWNDMDEDGAVAEGYPCESGNSITWKFEWTGNTGTRTFEWALYLIQ